MGTRGAFVAMTAEQEQLLVAAAGDQEVLEIIWEIESSVTEDYRVFCDSSWDAMHRCLTNGQLDIGKGPYPLDHVVLGPRQLHEGEDYIVSLVTPEQVRDVANALEGIAEEWFQDKYFNVLPKDYAPEYGQEDFEFTWSYFEEVRDLYARASTEGLAVVFSVGM
jgi:Domain of unknown function (DUF1877)